MRCRHTVPDWQKYVVSVTDTPPIFAACRLLLREGERASDSRAIACSYWRHQLDCPVYDGPEVRTEGSTGEQPLPIRPVASTEVPLAGEEPWPVRPPGALDGMRLIVIGLGLLSVALLVCAGVVALSVVRGTATPSWLVAVAMAAATVSIATHILTMLRAWAGR
jgi:hypothetical protein